MSVFDRNVPEGCPASPYEDDPPADPDATPTLAQRVRAYGDHAHAARLDLIRLMTALWYDAVEDRVVVPERHRNVVESLQGHIYRLAEEPPVDADELEDLE